MVGISGTGRRSIVRDGGRNAQSPDGHGALLLAGDVGATATSLGVFSSQAGLQHPLAIATFASSDFRSLDEVVLHFLRRVRVSVERACIGVAGPVLDGQANITNLPWSLDERQLAETLQLRSARLINDLVATAEAVPLLDANDILVLSEGEPVPRGPYAVVAPGTGLGEAFVTWDGERYRVHPSEGGHADFAPTNERQSGLLHYLRASYSHVSYERVCSGLGLRNLRAYLREVDYVREDPTHEAAVETAADPTREIVRAALDDEPCALCAEAVALFTEILAAEAANLALKVMATGGVYLAGGLPPRILPALQAPHFMSTFWGKGRCSAVVRQMPVNVLMNSTAALIGAAHHGLNGEFQ